jgi:hypothetical protein
MHDKSELPYQGEKMSHSLFHYTSLDGFLGIIQSGKLWASHIRFMNDRSEFNYAFDLTETVIRKLRMGRKLLHRPNIDPQRGIAQLFDDDIEKEDIYIISLSEKQDDLNMWKKYTDMSPGICIEFDTEKLRGNDIRIECVIYDLKKQKEFLEEKIIKCVEKADNDFDSSKILYESLIESAPQIKHPAFADEKEWRLIIRKPGEEIKFRVSGSIIHPYHEYCIDENEINSVLVGPCDNSDYAKQSIGFFCSRYCKNINNSNIRKSELPYR